MNKSDFKAKFKAAKYSGKLNTFFVSDQDYGRALKFVRHKFPKFKIRKHEDA